LAITRTVKSLDRVRRQAEFVLDRINLSPVSNELAGTLAYGQQRALEIGLTIAQDPELVLLDEPSAGLTPEETKLIVALIREITTDKTLLIVEHDMDVVFDLADRISVLNRGTIVAIGTPTEIKQNEMVKEVYLGNLFDPNSAQGG